VRASAAPPEKRRLGRSDLYVSEVGIGANTFGPPRLDKEESRRVVHAALDLGVNFVDTALVYGKGQSEEFLGSALASRRDEMVIATKFNFSVPDDGSIGERIIAQAELSLHKLQTDRIDLYQIHTPYAQAPPEEILAALQTLVEAGKVIAIGACNYASWRLAEAASIAQAHDLSGYVTVQNYYNLLDRGIESEIMPWCEEYGASILPYHPLAGGFLTGKYRDGQPAPAGTRGAAGSAIVKHVSTKRNYATLHELELFCAEAGHSVGELAVAWLLTHSTVGSVITGVSNPDQLEANVKASGWKLTDEEKQKVDLILTEFAGPPSNPERPPYM
jgi:aryl-alcohol dehydrogenase-like predicted oxidoreductase